MSEDPPASTPSTDEADRSEEERLLKRQSFERFVTNSCQRLSTAELNVTTDPITAPARPDAFRVNDLWSTCLGCVVIELSSDVIRALVVDQKDYKLVFYEDLKA